MSTPKTLTLTDQHVVRELRRPFSVHAVKFKVVSGMADGAIVCAYIDARSVIERLNQVVGLKWHDEYSDVPGGMQCRLTVLGTTRRDVGIGDKARGGGSDSGPKGLFSDSFKRAGAKFGIGVSIYAMPRMYVGEADVRRGNEPDKYGRKKVTGLTRGGEVSCRRQYEVWVESPEVVANFGAVLDHGDVADAIGDYDVEDVDSGEQEPERTGEPKARYANPDAPASKAQLERLLKLAKVTGVGEDDLPVFVDRLAAWYTRNDADPASGTAALTMGQYGRLEAGFGKWRDPADPNADVPEGQEAVTVGDKVAAAVAAWHPGGSNGEA